MFVYIDFVLVGKTDLFTIWKQCFSIFHQRTPNGREENTGKLFASRSLCSCGISVFHEFAGQSVITSASLPPPSVVSSALQRARNYISQTSRCFLLLSQGQPLKKRYFHEIRKAEIRRSAFLSGCCWDKCGQAADTGFAAASRSLAGLHCKLRQQELLDASRCTAAPGPASEIHPCWCCRWTFPHPPLMLVKASRFPYWNPSYWHQVAVFLTEHG